MGRNQKTGKSYQKEQMKFQSYKEFLVEFTGKPQFKWIADPKIGWWRDRKNVFFYHGTHKSNLDSMLATGIKAPSSGPTAGWVSLALDPWTARGYASMGGESGFRAAGAKAVTVPTEDRRILVVKMPIDYVLKNMEKNFRGNVDSTRDKLTNKDKYLAFKGLDRDYYALTEIRFPKIVEPRFILGWMMKK